jgi:hypothetical protein
LRAKVGKYFGPWKYGYVKWVSGKCILDVGRLFCTFKVTGIPAGCKIKLCDGRLLGNTTLCLPLYTYLGYQGVSGDVRGPWHAATVKCDDLNVAKKFCIFTVAGIPKERCGGVVDIKGIVSGLGNDKSFCAPNGAVIYCRARLPGNPPPPTGADISGPYHPVKVWCEKEELNVSKKFVKVTFKAGWKTCKDLITVIRDLNKGIGENTFGRERLHAARHGREPLHLVPQGLLRGHVCHLEGRLCDDEAEAGPGVGSSGLSKDQDIPPVRGGDVPFPGSWAGR